jgi:diguanylate cyclase (GGDEF)-like protein
MDIRLTGRHDGLLLAGLAVALLTVFDRSIAWVISLAHEVETGYGVRLVPALVVLTAIVVAHQHVRRKESKAEAAASAASVRDAAERMAQLERLQALSQTVAAALTVESIQAVMWKYLPIITGERSAWVTTLADGRCEVLYDASATPGTRLEAITLQVVEATGKDPGRILPVRHEGWCCFPMLAGGHIIGILGVAETNADDAIGSETGRLLAAASAVLGIALRNVQLFTELRETAVTDSLTGYFNKAHVLDMFAGELRRSRRTGSEMAVLMLDVDGFKALNDAHGHLAGDAALRAIARRCRHVLRQSDLRCRYGGDEFLFLLPDTPLGGAAHVAEMLRREVETLQIPLGTGRVALTCSIGIASVVPGELDPVSSIHRADKALYQAKRDGRNQVAVYDPAIDAAAVDPPVFAQSA